MRLIVPRLGAAALYLVVAYRSCFCRSHHLPRYLPLIHQRTPGSKKRTSRTRIPCEPFVSASSSFPGSFTSQKSLANRRVVRAIIRVGRQAIIRASLAQISLELSARCNFHFRLLCLARPWHVFKKDINSPQDTERTPRIRDLNKAMKR
jgi:hypothetical protein